ncbi:MAG: hypothetical protein V1793_20595 [Pseudomonadota bacterium]
MGFKQDLLKKIRINDLAARIRHSLGPVGSGSKVDRDAVRELLGFTDFKQRRERDLELYVRDRVARETWVLVLDNDLPLYRTSVDDVVLRKSPTVKEMISIRNAVKILSDSDVLVSKKGDTLSGVKDELLDSLDLTWTMDELEGLIADLKDALARQDSDAVDLEIRLFAEIFEYQRPPEAFGLGRFNLWGRVVRDPSNEFLFGPVLVHVPDTGRLLVHTPAVGSLDRDAILALQTLAEGLGGEALKGEAVFEFLRQEAKEHLPGHA